MNEAEEQFEGGKAAVVEVEVSAPKKKRAKRKKAPVAKAPAKKRGPKAAAKKRGPKPKKKAGANAAENKKEAVFPAVEKAIAAARKAFAEGEKAMLKAESAIEKAMKGLSAADETLMQRRIAARTRGTVGAKNALARAQEKKRQATDVLRTAKLDFRAAKKSIQSLTLDIKRLERVETRLAKIAEGEQIRLMKKLLSEEKKQLQALRAPRRKKRKARAKAPVAEEGVSAADTAATD